MPQLLSVNFQGIPENAAFPLNIGSGATQRVGSIITPDPMCNCVVTLSAETTQHTDPFRGPSPKGPPL